MNAYAKQARGTSVSRKLTFIRVTIILLALPVAFAHLVAHPASAVGSQYTVRQCDGASHQGFDGVQRILGGVDRVDFVVGCASRDTDRIGVHQDRSGRPMNEGLGGEYRWVAPTESVVISTRFEIRMKSANGVRASPVGQGSNGDGVSLDGNQPHDGSLVTARWESSRDPLRWVAARLICRQDACANKPDSTKAFVTVFDTEFTLVDNTPPAINPGGALLDWSRDGKWHSGPAEAKLQASDGGGGIAKAWVQVNGSISTLGLLACPGSRGSYSVTMAPCLPSVNQRAQLNTTASPFREGPNTVRFCAEDFHTSTGTPNRACTDSATVRIDNEPPAAPVALHTVGGTDWRPENGFRFEWRDPAGQVAPIAGGRFRVTDLVSGETVTEEDFENPPVEELGPVQMPEPGEYEVELRLRDAAGNLGEPATTLARFDDRAPGDVAPEAPGGWISADELPLRQVIERAEARGPSGIGGYALSVASDGPIGPCPSGRCLDPPFALTGGADDRIGSIPGLTEGTHWVSAVASSGASVASENAGSIQVRVDRTPPRVTIGGLTGKWANRPVTLTAAATDDLSGMRSQAGDDGAPETVIQAEGFSPYRVPGASASFTVTSEGESLVRYWARDLAGNVNDGRPGPDGTRHPPAGEAVVRIDTEAPKLRFVRNRDAADPERVDLTVSDAASGVASAGVALRRAGSRESFRTVPTSKTAEGVFSARIPSDDLPAGTYELRATGTDRAGNVSRDDRDEHGSPMILRLPLKKVSRLAANLGKRHSRAMKASYRQRPVLRGRLTSAGAGVSAAPLRVVERFAPGSHPANRITTVRTDGTGRYSSRLRAGPSRHITVVYPGTRLRARRKSRTVRVDATGQVSFSLRPTRVYNRGAVRMKGRVGRAGAIVPARGKLVAVQYFDPARSKWRPVEVLRTRRNGTFHYGYRFRTIASAQRIMFRAVSLNEAGWPYLHSTSAARSVIVFPRS